MLTQIISRNLLKFMRGGTSDYKREGERIESAVRVPWSVFLVNVVPQHIRRLEGAGALSTWERQIHPRLFKEGVLSLFPPCHVAFFILQGMLAAYVILPGWITSVNMLYSWTGVVSMLRAADAILQIGSSVVFTSHSRRVAAVPTLHVGSVDCIVVFPMLQGKISAASFL